MRRLYCKWTVIVIWLCYSFIQPIANAEDEEAYGQVIQIYTRIHSYVGKPSWLLIIRDIDHNRVYPYVYDFQQGTNYWVAFSHSRNYLITVSKIRSGTYRSRKNDYKEYTISNFCHLESQGQIIRDQSLYITVDGDITPSGDEVQCHVSRYASSNFTVAPPIETVVEPEEPANEPEPAPAPANNNPPVPPTPTPPSPPNTPVQANTPAEPTNTVPTPPATTPLVTPPPINPTPTNPS